MINRNSIKKNLGNYLLAFALLAGCENTVLEEKLDTKTRVPPHISYYEKSGLCAGYATRAAKELYGIEYAREDSWNLRYVNSALEVKEESSISDLLNDAEIGDLLGIHYPASRHNGKLDRQGNTRKYTHVAIYSGKNENGNDEILHNFNGPRYEELTPFLERHNCKVKEIIKGKRKK